MSYVAKLYCNKLNFPSHTERLTFVSNIFVDCTLKSGATAADQEEIAFEEITGKECKKISDAVKRQCKLEDEPTLVGVLTFNASRISLHDHVGHAKGKVTEFLERLVPGNKIRPGAVYRGLAGEVLRRNNCTENCSSLEEIAEKKGLSRERVESLLRAMRVYETDTPLWAVVESRLNSERCPFARVAALKRKWPGVLARHSDPMNTLFRDAFRRVGESVREFQPTDRLIDWLDGIVARVPMDSECFKILDEEEIRVIALINLYDET